METVLSFPLTMAAHVFLKDPSPDQIFLDWQSFLASLPQKVFDFVWH